MRILMYFIFGSNIRNKCAAYHKVLFWSKRKETLVHPEKSHKNNQINLNNLDGHKQLHSLDLLIK